MDRSDKALEFVDLGGRGLEIGPSYSPLVPKSSGARVETLDHATRDELRDKYRGYGLDAALLDRIETVDHLWHGGALIDAVPERGAYDYIVASHFIEHTVDFIGFLQDCEALLNDGGRLALVVPDKRYCFDRFQPITSIGTIVDAHHRPTSFHPAGSLLDHQAYASKRDEAIAWSAGDRAALALQFPNLEGADEVIAQGLKQDAYSDIHRWKFTPSSFRLLIHDLHALGYHNMQLVGWHDTEGYEFFATLGRVGADVPVDRLALIRETELELVSAAIGTTDIDGLASRGALAAENESLKAEVAGLRSSTSWRVTKPLRALSDVVRRVRRH